MTSNIPPLDLTKFTKLHQMMGLPLLRELVDQYSVSSMSNLRKMQSAADQGDAELLIRTAHGSKGSSGTLSATTLSELCRRLEKDARAGKLEHSTQQVEQIGHELERFLNALQTELRRMENT